MGLVLTNLEFGLALLKPTDASDTTSLLRLERERSVAVVGVEGSRSGPTSSPSKSTVRAGTRESSISQATFNDGNATNNPDGLKVQTGPDPDGSGEAEAPFVLLDFEDAFIKASGFVTLVIENFVYVSRQLRVQKSDTPETVGLTNGTTKTVNVLHHRRQRCERLCRHGES